MIKCVKIRRVKTQINEVQEGGKPVKKETETKKRNNDFWLYEMLAIGLVVFLMALYFLFMLFEWGFKKAGLRKIANDIEALNYKVLVKILFYLKMRQ